MFSKFLNFNNWSNGYISMRFPDHFTTTAEEAGQIKEKCELMIDEALKKVHFRPRVKRGPIDKLSKLSKSSQKSAHSTTTVIKNI